MVVRVRLPSGGGKTAVKMWTAWWLKAFALVCFAIGVWIISAGLRWAGAFLVEQGTFSHWQVWIACGVMAQLGAFRLNRTKPAVAILKT
jgi:hypothetical protein